MYHPAKRHSGSWGGTGLYREKQTPIEACTKIFKKTWFLGKYVNFQFSEHVHVNFVTTLINKSVDSYVVVETKNNDGLHFCTTEIYVPQEYFRMCNIRRQLLFCCDHVVDDVRRWQETLWRH